jgi:serine/threonine-protein kinase
VHVAEQVARALAYAHRPVADGGVAGLVHRDVSPHNILVSFEGEVKLTDFGIARVPGTGGLTGPGMLKGKLGYMAPEQASDAPVDARADLFALGVVLWETCTGQRLFARDNEVATLRALTGADPVVPPSFWNEGVPAALDAIVLGTLERDPTRRIATADEVAERLAEVELALSRTPEERDLRPLMRRLWPGEVPSRPTPTPSPPQASPGPAPSPASATTATWPTPRTGRTPVLAALGLLVGMAVGTGWWVGSGLRSPATKPVEGRAAAIPPAVLEGEGSAPKAIAPDSLSVVPASPPTSTPAPAGAAPAAQVDPATEAVPRPASGSASPRPPFRSRTRPGVLASADALEGLEIPAAATGEGILFVNAQPWAEIHLDGRVEGYTPREMRLSAGRHRLRLVHPTRGTVERVAEVRAGERLRVEIPLGP